MAYLSYILLPLGISALIWFHDFGHFISARLCGVRVERFSFGLGPEIVGAYDRYATRWCLSAIPFAGFMPLYASKATSDDLQQHYVRYDQSTTRTRLIIVLAGPLFSVIF